MKVKVNTDQCIGCGACVAINPENFDFNDEGLSVVKNENGIEASIEASEACPVCAIEIINECNCKNGEECTCGDNCKCGEGCNCGDNCECGEGCNCGDNCECSDDCNCGDDCECGDKEDACCCEHCGCKKEA